MTTESTPLAQRLRETESERDLLAALLYLEHLDLHPMYANTSYRGRGIGGGTITQQCSVVRPEGDEFALIERIETAIREQARRMEREGGSLSDLAQRLRAGTLPALADSTEKGGTDA